MTNILRMTRSQQMALLSIIMTHAGNEAEPQQFINCSEDPAVTTTSGELLQMVMEARVVDDSKIKDMQERLAENKLSPNDGLDHLRGEISYFSDFTDNLVLDFLLLRSENMWKLLWRQSWNQL